MINRVVLNETSYFGRGSRHKLADEVSARGDPIVFIVSDYSLMEAKVTEKVIDVVDKAGITYFVYNHVKPNPTVKNVQDGLTLAEINNVDAIVAVGGGSVIDTAKAISIIMTNTEHSGVTSLDGAVETRNKGLPLFALPTTAGTAAEVTINYVITDEDAQVKMVCVDPHDIPLLAIVDSELMESLPKMTAAATGLDALTHAVEGYITKAHNTMSDMFHMRAIELIFENLPAAVNEKNTKAIENMALAQYIAGMGFSNVGLGIVHSLAHQLGAVYDTPHGIANAILLPTVMRFNGEVSWERFREILIHIGRPDAANLSKQDVINTFVWKISELAKECGVTMTVKDTGCKEEDLEMLAEKAMNDPCRPGNPRDTTKEDFINLYRAAM